MIKKERRKIYFKQKSFEENLKMKKTHNFIDFKALDFPNSHNKF